MSWSLTSRVYLISPCYQTWLVWHPYPQREIYFQLKIHKFWGTVAKMWKNRVSKCCSLFSIIGIKKKIKNFEDRVNLVTPVVVLYICVQDVLVKLRDLDTSNNGISNYVMSWISANGHVTYKQLNHKEPSWHIPVMYIGNTLCHFKDSYHILQDYF